MTLPVLVSRGFLAPSPTPHEIEPTTQVCSTCGVTLERIRRGDALTWREYARHGVILR